MLNQVEILKKSMFLMSVALFTGCKLSTSPIYSDMENDFFLSNEDDGLSPFLSPKINFDIPKDPPKETICEIEKISVKRGKFNSKKEAYTWKDTVYLPKSGVFHQEGHLATKNDNFSKNRIYPQWETEDIMDHLSRSAKILGAKVSDIYTNPWAKKWTPPENGRAGQGSAGKILPSVAEEMFIFNMMFRGDSRPPIGEKWLMSYNGKYVVVVGGYEIGPSSRSRLGGVQPEVLYVLGAKTPARLTIHGPLMDQSYKPGAINCESLKYSNPTK